jgi:hypothetical protein
MVIIVVVILALFFIFQRKKKPAEDSNVEVDQTDNTKDSVPDTTQAYTDQVQVMPNLPNQVPMQTTMSPEQFALLQQQQLQQLQQIQLLQQQQMQQQQLQKQQVEQEQQQETKMDVQPNLETADLPKLPPTNTSETEMTETKDEINTENS